MESLTAMLRQMGYGWRLGVDDVIIVSYSITCRLTPEQRSAICAEAARCGKKVEFKTM